MGRAAAALALAATMLAAPNTHATHEKYIAAYNQIASNINGRLSAASSKRLPYRSPGGAGITPIDMCAVRSIARELAEYTFVWPPAFNLNAATIEEAFPRALRYAGQGGLPIQPSAIDGIGRNGMFTKIPGEYTGSGETLYATNFSDGPVLWIHFEEVNELVNRLRFTRQLGNWTANGERNSRYGTSGVGPDSTWIGVRETAQNAYWSGSSIADVAPCAYTIGAKGRFGGTWPVMYYFEATIARRYAYGRVEPYAFGTTAPRRFSFYIKGYNPDSPDYTICDNGDAFSTDRTCVWESEWRQDTGPVLSPVVGNTALDAPEWCEEPDLEAPHHHWHGYSMEGDPWVVTEWNYPAGPLPVPAQWDSESDGLVHIGCECKDCVWKNEVEVIEGAEAPLVRWPLGLSVGWGNGGVRVKSYVSEYELGGVTRQQFSLDTHAARSWHDAEGWDFYTVQRPSGAEVTFALRGERAGWPVDSSRGYRMRKVDGRVEIHFPGERKIVHCYTEQGWIMQVRATPSKSEVTVGVSRGGAPGMSACRNYDSYWCTWGPVLSNRCPEVTAILGYAGGLVRSVEYRDAAGNPLGSSVFQQGSKVYIARDAAGTVTDRLHIVCGESGGFEIWRGVSESGGELDVALRETREQDEPSGDAIVRREIRMLNPGAADAQAVTTICAVTRFPWGEEVTARTEGADTALPETTRFMFWTNRADTANYGRLRRVEEPWGAWREYEYDVAGRQTIERCGLGNARPDDPGPCRVERRVYAGDPALEALGFPAEDTPDFADSRARLTVEEFDGQEVSRTYTAYLPDRRIARRCLVAGARYDDASNAVQTTVWHTTGPYAGMARRMESEDGTLSVFRYGQDGAGNCLTTNDAGAGVGETVTNGTRTVRVAGLAGRLARETRTDILSGVVFADSIYVRDAYGRALCVSNALAGTYETWTYGCCGPDTVRDAEGIVTTHRYTPLGQPFAVERGGMTEFFRYDARGNVIEERRTAAGLPDAVRGMEYDAAGRLTAEVDEMGGRTQYERGTNAAGERVETVRYADGATRVETYARDGTLLSVSGTAAVAASYVQGADAAGPFSIEYAGADTNAMEWVCARADRLGRVVAVRFPDGHEQRSEYGGRGLLIREDSGRAVRLVQYDDRGRPTREAVDMNGTGEVEPDGPDRVMETQSRFVVLDGTPMEETVVLAGVTEGQPPSEMSLRRRSLDGKFEQTVEAGRTNTVRLQLDAGAAARERVVELADGTRATEWVTNGLLRAIARFGSDGARVGWTRFEYDGMGRIQAAEEPSADGGIRRAELVRDAAGKVAREVVRSGALARTNELFHDSRGRLVRQVRPDGGAVERRYTARGELEREWGAGVLPVSMTYDSRGRLATHSTYRKGFEGPADTTRWEYDARRGWPAAKVYADGTACRFEHEPDGRMTRRTWARGVVTDYQRDPAGAVTNIAYSDGTPSVQIRFDRLGRPVTIADGTGMRTNRYTAAGELGETGAPQWGGAVSFDYDAVGRRVGMMVGRGEGVAAETEYGYDLAGRLAGVSSRGRTAFYRYAEDGTSVEGLTIDGGGPVPLAVEYRRDGLDRLKSIAYEASGTNLASHVYEYDMSDRRARCRLADGSCWEYGYDALWQVTSGCKYWPDGGPVGGAQFRYRYDGSGNRVSANLGLAAGLDDAAATVFYQANELNQYVNLSVSAEVLVAGRAHPEARVVVGETNRAARLANRHGETFWRTVPVDPSAGGRCVTAVVVASRTVAEGSATNCLVRTESRVVHVPCSPRRFEYDADGNLTADGEFRYEWDGENRLIATETAEGVAPRWRWENGYDWAGRRVAQREYEWAGEEWKLRGTATWVHDGWNPVIEVRTTSIGARTNAYVWGLDIGEMAGSPYALSQGPGGAAGGIGGLIAIFEGPESAPHFPVYDGNGNVMGLSDPSGALSARYDYGPFGEPVLSDPASSAPRFGFSTKLWNPRAGHADFGYRRYSCATGRWTSRDPVAESGGPNLYAFLGNNPVNSIDPLGLQWWNPEDPNFVSMVPLRWVRRGVHVVGTGVRVAGGIVPSILSGDSFDESRIQTVFAPDQCEFLITVNGIANDDDAARAMQDLASLKFGLPGTRVKNNTHMFGIGDAFQILGHEVGLIDVTSRRAAKQIRQAYKWGRAQGCPCIRVIVLAHSQGTMIFRRALPLLSAEERRTIEYHGDGGESFVGPGHGLSSVDNSWNRSERKTSLFFGWDPVPLVGTYLNPLKLFGIPFYMEGGTVTTIRTPPDVTTGLPIEGNDHSWMPFYSWRYSVN